MNSALFLLNTAAGMVNAVESKLHGVAFKCDILGIHISNGKQNGIATNASKFFN